MNYDKGMFIPTGRQLLWFMIYHMPGIDWWSILLNFNLCSKKCITTNNIITFW